MPTSTWRSRQVRDKPVTSPSICPPTSPCLVADVADFPVDLSPTQTGWLPTCYGDFASHLDMSRWFETPKYPRGFPVTWSMPAIAGDFPETSPGKFRGSQRNGIWAILHKSRIHQVYHAWQTFGRKRFIRFLWWFQEGYEIFSALFNVWTGHCRRACVNIFMCNHEMATLTTSVRREGCRCAVLFIC